jgi:hypothetical protein
LKPFVRFGVLGAFIALAAAMGVIHSFKVTTTVDAQIPAGLAVTKVCASTSIPINTNTTCTVTVTAQAAASFAEPLVLVVSPANTGNGTNPGFGQIQLLNGVSGATGPDVDAVVLTNVIGAPQTISIGCTGATCDFAIGDTITIVEGIRGVVGGSTQETLQFGGAAVPVTLAPSVTVGAATVTATVTCNPTTVVAGAAASGTAVPPAAGTTACVIDFNDNDAFPTVVSSANVTVTVIGPAGVVLSSTGTTTGSFTCQAGGPINAPQTCDTVTVNLASTTPGLSGQVQLQVNYIPDLPAVDGANVFTLNAFTLSAVGPVAAFVQPIALAIACTSAITGPFTGPFPGPIGTVNVVAIGILPGSIACQITFLNAAGMPIIVAPGTVEVSTLSGTLLTANGQLTTNLRIVCGGVTGAVIGAAINPNNCQGVQFQVLGLGVGFVDITARYEPSSIAAAAGIREIEGTANVAFVAPVVTVSLLLSPNPVVVGATGTATARFNRTFNCAAAFGVTIAAGTACIDPTTGLPIAFNFGSALNGSVVFTIDNTAIASWVDAVTSTPVALPQVSGFTGTAAQVIKRCGFFPTTGLPAVGVPGLQPFGPVSGPLANFFGGCDSADARYRGNIAGVAQVSATFIPDLPGAFGTNLVGLNTNVSALLGLFSGTGQPFQTRTLEVVAAAPSGAVALARGCNNVSPTVTEAASAYAARVTPAGALVAIWEHQAANNTFRGFSPMAGAPNDLPGVTRLRPVFVCVSAAANLDQPPA